MSGLGMLRAARQRIEDSCLARGILYPWWVPLLGTAGQVVCTALALDQRDALWPLDPLVLTLPMVLAPSVVQFGWRVWVPWWLDALPALVATGWLLSVQPTYDVLSPVDAAPGLLAFVIAEITARDGVLRGTVVAAASYALLGAAAIGSGLVGLGVYAVFLEVGFVVGAMLLWQMRALVAEREAREAAWQQATTAERERIAREIHDLVAHSLSVTLLHITGARHALRDVVDGSASPADAIDEADAALGDAEQIGRRAMADIRRTISAMSESDTGLRQPLPGAADIAALVRQTAEAGLDVRYDEQGDPSRLSGAAGLGLYRIAQESLANVAKHAPSTATRVRFSVGRTGAHLTVRNRLDGQVRPPDGVGSGLAGMQARAEQLGATLTAGPSGQEWVVDVRLGSGTPGCSVTKLVGDRLHDAPAAVEVPQ
jgi:signal transduction histidine kinase